jgi:hypothetical protein
MGSVLAQSIDRSFTQCRRNNSRTANIVQRTFLAPKHETTSIGEATISSK